MRNHNCQVHNLFTKKMFKSSVSSFATRTTIGGSQRRKFKCPKTTRMILLVLLLMWIPNAQIFALFHSDKRNPEITPRLDDDLKPSIIYNLSKSWRNCKTIMGEGSFFSDLLDSNSYEILRNPKYPPMGCESISVPNIATSVVEEYWKLDAFPNARFYSREVVHNLCETFGTSSNLLPNCTQVLCDDKGERMSEIIGDRIFDFINYCHYCSMAKGFQEYHQLLENQTCRNSNSSIQTMVTSFPKYIRYCGAINIGIPVITPLTTNSLKQKIPYIYTCYCFQSDQFELFCDKKGAISIMNDFKKVGMTLASSILAIAALFLLVIPKLLIWIQVPNHDYTFLQISPSIVVLLSLCCRIVSLHVPQPMYPFQWFTMFSSIAEFLNYCTLLLILMYWFGVMRYLQTHRRTSAWKKYLLCMIGLLCCIGLSVELGFLEMQIPRNFTNVVWVLVSWMVEMVIFAIFGCFSLFIYLALKRITEINSIQTSVSVRVQFIETKGSNDSFSWRFN